MIHDCENCADCLHDSHGCCGCYDGACCTTTSTQKGGTK